MPRKAKLDSTTSPTSAELIDAVGRLRPVIEANASRAEAERRLRDQVYEAMIDARLFDMCAPRAYGGLEFHLVESMHVWEAVARIDSAAAWNLVMNQAIAAVAAWLPEKGARELHGDGPTTVAGAFFPPGSATRAEGGWRITAQVPFASGCDNARWFVAPAVELDGDEPRVDPRTGAPVIYGAVVPREEADVMDTWNTVGMRGTGSADIKLEDVFVPDHRVFTVLALAGEGLSVKSESPPPGFEGPLYRMFPWPAILGEATVSVGVAAAAVEDVIRLAQTKTAAYNATPMRDQQLAQHAVGRAKARVDAARDTLHRAAEEAYDDAATGPRLSWDAKVRLQLAVSFAAETCAEAVRLVNEAAGASAIRIGQRFERYFRDAHVLTQHTSKASPRYASAGRLLFGLENDWLWLSF